MLRLHFVSKNSGKLRFLVWYAYFPPTPHKKKQKKKEKIPPP